MVVLHTASLMVADHDVHFPSAPMQHFNPVLRACVSSTEVARDAPLPGVIKPFDQEAHHIVLSMVEAAYAMSKAAKKLLRGKVPSIVVLRTGVATSAHFAGVTNLLEQEASHAVLNTAVAESVVLNTAQPQHSRVVHFSATSMVAAKYAQRRAVRPWQDTRTKTTTRTDYAGIVPCRPAPVNFYQVAIRSKLVASSMLWKPRQVSPTHMYTLTMPMNVRAQRNQALFLEDEFDPIPSCGIDTKGPRPHVKRDL